MLKLGTVNVTDTLRSPYNTIYMPVWHHQAIGDDGGLFFDKPQNFVNSMEIDLTKKGYFDCHDNNVKETMQTQ